MKKITADHIHDLSMNNGKYKETSKEYGCFYCLNIRDANILNEEDKLCQGEDTYFCRICGIDSVIFDSAYKFDEKLLRKMQQERFDIKQDTIIKKTTSFLHTRLIWVPRRIFVNIYDHFKYPEIKNRGRTEHFFELSLWSGGYPAHIFEDFTFKGYGSFNPEKQKQLKKDNIFSNEEFDLLKNIYDLMMVYWDDCPNIHETDLKDNKAKKIEVLIIKFFNLPSMEKDFGIIKKGKYYDGFAG